MENIESLSTYPNYWTSCLVPHSLIGKINCPVQLKKGWTCHQAMFFQSYLGGSTNEEHSMLLLTPPAMLIHTCPYTEIPKQPCNPMLDIVNPVTSEVPMIQPAQPDNPDAQVILSKA